MTIEVSDSVASNVVAVGPAEAGAPDAKKAGRFVFVDALRGVAALWVVCYHVYLGKHAYLIMDWMPRPFVALFESGHYGVPIFFVLSGFVIAHSVSRHRVDAAFIGRFILRRSIRLDPPYWASMVLMVTLGLISNLANHSDSYQPPSLPSVAAHLLYLQGILGFELISGVYWTLAFEVQFYLVFCMLVGLAHATRRDAADKRSLFLVFVPALMIAALWPLGILPWAPWPVYFPPLWHGFLLGMLACWAMNGTVRPGWFYAYAALLGIGGAWNGHGFTVACVLTSVLLHVADRAGGLARWLGWRWLQFLGLVSYSLYLTHQPIMGAFYNVAYRLTRESLISEAFWSAAMLGVIIAAAAALWWLVERPSLALAHRFSLRRK